MLTDIQINELHQFLQEDIKLLNLTGNEIPEQVGCYLENISGLENLSCNELEHLINKIITPSS